MGQCVCVCRAATSSPASLVVNGPHLHLRKTTSKQPTQNRNRFSPPQRLLFRQEHSKKFLQPETTAAFPQKHCSSRTRLTDEIVRACTNAVSTKEQTSEYTIGDTCWDNAVHMWISYHFEWKVYSFVKNIQLPLTVVEAQLHAQEMNLAIGKNRRSQR